MISILMPVYNAEPYLEDCLESVVNQSYTDWELIAINDFSTDDSFKILSSYQEDDQRIKVFQNTEKGIIPALSLAHSKANGKYISRMDADDLMTPEKLRSMEKVIRENPSAIVTSKVKYFSSQGISGGYEKYESWLNLLMENDSHYSSIYQECVLPSPNWLMSSNTLDLIGGFSTLNYPEDYDLCFKAYQEKIQIIGLNEVLHLWRDYPERTSRNDPNYADNRFLNMKIEYFLKCDLDHSKPLILWGAGKKGKLLARLLIDSNIEFHWITNNEQKLKVPIYNKQLIHQNNLDQFKNARIILAIAQKDALTDLEEMTKGLESVQIFKFC